MSSFDITGIVRNLTGRMDSIEAQSTYVNQQLLQRPGLQEFSNFQVVWNSELNTLSTLCTKIDNQIKTLQQLFVNLNMTVSSNFATFKAHTGLAGLHNALPPP